jgi:sec-independent protein translocase protein TatA
MELFQPWHLIIVAGIAILLFGGRKLPELGKGLGEGLRGFKEGMKGITEDPSKPASIPLRPSLSQRPTKPRSRPQHKSHRVHPTAHRSDVSGISAPSLFSFEV